MNHGSHDKPQPLPEPLAEERDQLQVQFGQHLRELRLAQGLTLENLAERAELHSNYVGSVERGERNLSLFNIWRLACGLQLPVGDLVDRLPGQRKPRA